jgi:hypothetical protein
MLFTIIEPKYNKNKKEKFIKKMNYKGDNEDSESLSSNSMKTFINTIKNHSYDNDKENVNMPLEGYNNENLDNNELCNLNDKVNEIIRKSLLSNANICKPKKKLSRNDIDKNRENVFGFRDYVFQTSNEEDAIDRINELYLDGNSDVTKKYKGMKIKDIFDDITKGNNIYNKYKL